MSSSLTTEEIVLINNLLYAEGLGGDSGTFLSESQENKSIGEYVDNVLRNIDKIDDNKEYSTGMTGAEYKQILNAVKNDPHLQNVVISDVHYETADQGGGRSVLLVDPSSNEAIVAFKGTQSDAEWVDNVSGLYKVPTEYQDNALKWYKSLDLSGYDNITVTGHSKGGNKAKYITLMDDSVDNCYSFDGQGFSDEFIDQYGSNIVRNGDKIVNINAKSDFVNILLNDVGQKRYYEGTNYGRLGFGENHCSNAICFFDKDGNMSLRLAAGQDPRMAELDKMLNSFIRSCPMEERENVANLLGNVIISATNGDTEGIIDLFTGDKYSDCAADLMAYIAKYKKVNPQMMDYLKEILEENGVDTSMLWAADFITNNDWLMRLIGEHPDQILWAMDKLGVDQKYIDLLRNHPELFAFLVKVANKMDDIDPTKYNGNDRRPVTIGPPAATGPGTVFSIDIDSVKASIAAIESCKDAQIRALAEVNNVIGELDFAIRVLVEISLIAIRLKILGEISRLSKLSSALTQIVNLYESSEQSVLEAMGN